MAVRRLHMLKVSGDLRRINSGKRHDNFLPPSCVLLLNGFPGVGKFTVAKALEAELITKGTPHRLFDNNLIIDAAEELLPGRASEHYALRKQFRDGAFKALQTLEEEKLVIIMTACLVKQQMTWICLLNMLVLLREEVCPWSWLILCATPRPTVRGYVVRNGDMVRRRS
jgi:hypothetical protein